MNVSIRPRSLASLLKSPLSQIFTEMSEFAEYTEVKFTISGDGREIERMREFQNKHREEVAIHLEKIDSSEDSETNLSEREGSESESKNLHRVKLREVEKLDLIMEYFPQEFEQLTGKHEVKFNLLKQKKYISFFAKEKGISFNARLLEKDFDRMLSMFKTLRLSSSEGFSAEQKKFFACVQKQKGLIQLKELQKNKEVLFMAMANEKNDGDITFLLERMKSIKELSIDLVERVFIKDHNYRLQNKYFITFQQERLREDLEKNYAFMIAKASEKEMKLKLLGNRETINEQIEELGTRVRDLFLYKKEHMIPEKDFGLIKDPIDRMPKRMELRGVELLHEVYYLRDHSKAIIRIISNKEDEFLELKEKILEILESIEKLKIDDEKIVRFYKKEGKLFDNILRDNNANLAEFSKFISISVLKDRKKELHETLIKLYEENTTDLFEYDFEHKFKVKVFETHFLERFKEDLKDLSEENVKANKNCFRETKLAFLARKTNFPKIKTILESYQKEISNKVHESTVQCASLEEHQVVKKYMKEITRFAYDNDVEIEIQGGQGGEDSKLLYKIQDSVSLSLLTSFKEERLKLKKTAVVVHIDSDGSWLNQEEVQALQDERQEVLLMLKKRENGEKVAYDRKLEYKKRFPDKKIFSYYISIIDDRANPNKNFFYFEKYTVAHNLNLMLESVYEHNYSNLAVFVPSKVQDAVKEVLDTLFRSLEERYRMACENENYRLKLSNIFLVFSGEELKAKAVERVENHIKAFSKKPEAPGNKGFSEPRLIWKYFQDTVFLEYPRQCCEILDKCVSAGVKEVILPLESERKLENESDLEFFFYEGLTMVLVRFRKKLLALDSLIKQLKPEQMWEFWFLNDPWFKNQNYKRVLGIDRLKLGVRHNSKKKNLYGPDKVQYDLKCREKFAGIDVWRVHPVDLVQQVYRKELKNGDVLTLQIKKETRISSAASREEGGFNLKIAQEEAGQNFASLVVRGEDKHIKGEPPKIGVEQELRNYIQRLKFKEEDLRRGKKLLDDKSLDDVNIIHKYFKLNCRLFQLDLLLEELNPESDEYLNNIEKVLKADEKAFFEKYEILKAERVENFPVYNQFVSRYERMSGKRGKPIERRILYHGTSDTHPSLIYSGEEQCFDINFAKDESDMGRGIYFHDNPENCFIFNSYREGKAEKARRKFFICDVVIGQVRENQAVEFDSERSMIPGAKSSSSYKITNNLAAYPLYMVTVRQRTD